jgi:hypothetical protein
LVANYLDFDILFSQCETTGDVPEDPFDAHPPRSLLLSQNFPNPFNPLTTIGFEIPGAADGYTQVELSIFDLRGRLMKKVVQGKVATGRHYVTWDGTDQKGERVSSGVYLYRINAGNSRETRKMLLLK